MTCHNPNLSLKIDKIKGFEIKEEMPEMFNIPYTLIIQKGEEAKAITLLEELIKEIRIKAKT